MTCCLIIQFDCQIFSHIIHQIFNQTHKNKVFAFVYPAKNISLWYRHERWWQRLTLKELLKHNKQINDGETAGNIRNRVSLVPRVLTVHLVYMWSRDIFTKVSIDIMIPLHVIVSARMEQTEVDQTIKRFYELSKIFTYLPKLFLWSKKYLWCNSQT